MGPQASQAAMPATMRGRICRRRLVRLSLSAARFGWAELHLHRLEQILRFSKRRFSRDHNADLRCRKAVLTKDPQPAAEWRTSKAQAGESHG